MGVSVPPDGAGRHAPAPSSGGGSTPGSLQDRSYQLMQSKTIPARSDVPVESKWNLEAVFQQDSQWETEYSQVSPLVDQLRSYRGRLGDSAEALLASFKLRDDINYRLERLFAYARMRRDEENTNPHYQALEDRARVLWVRVEEASSYFDPELLDVGREKIDSFLTGNDELKTYSHLLDDLFREQEHMLSAK